MLDGQQLARVHTNLRGGLSTISIKDIHPLPALAFYHHRQNRRRKRRKKRAGSFLFPTHRHSTLWDMLRIHDDETKANLFLLLLLLVSPLLSRASDYLWKPTKKSPTTLPSVVTIRHSFHPIPQQRDFFFKLFWKTRDNCDAIHRRQVEEEEEMYLFHVRELRKSFP